LDNLVLQRCDRERALPAIRLGDVHPPGGQCPIHSPVDPMVQVLDMAFEVCLVVLPRAASFLSSKNATSSSSIPLGWIGSMKPNVSLEDLARAG
jgi:hypothetical protein